MIFQGKKSMYKYFYPFLDFIKDLSLILAGFMSHSFNFSGKNNFVYIEKL